MIGHLLFTAAVATAIAVISYSGFARANGWPIASVLAADASVPKIVSFVAILWALVKALLIFHWWSPIVILIGGWALAFGLVMTLKKNVQVVCLFGAVPAFVGIVLYQSETRPFGFLHVLF